MIEKGQKINDRYEIIKNIGEGGMANVYLAYDVILDRKVAIKVLRGDLSNDEKFVRRFQREALSASSLAHSSIVEMYDVGEDNGIYYIVMEYVEGKTLKQLIKKRGNITLSEAIDIMLQLTEGITEAHESYIIHRDLKPQNILIKEDGTIKVTDFGIAMALNATQLTQTNSVMGSVHYLPPEQASGKGSTIRSDIYSMGIMFYELLAGTLPFKGDNAVEIALKQMRDTIPSIRKKNPAIPQSVENIILRATAKNPKNRYSDAKEMHEDLLTALDDERSDEPKLVFKYSEVEVDDSTRNLSAVKKKTEKQMQEERPEKLKKKKEPKEEISEDEEEKDPVKEDKFVKRTNRIVWILTSIFGLIVLGFLFIFFIMPYISRIPDVKIPNVTGMEVLKAEEMLKRAGFEIANETTKEENDEFEPGTVIRTSPQAGSVRKKGTTVTIFESLGKDTYKIEDYTGENYIEIETLLKNVHGLRVEIKKKDVDMADNYGPMEIIDQSLTPGTVVAKGDRITLYIPNVLEEYPDMVAESWTEADVKAFATKYSLDLSITYRGDDSIAPGIVLSQSRAPRTRIISGATLRVEISEPEGGLNSSGQPPGGGGL